MSIGWDGNAYDKISDPQFGWGMKLLASVQLRGDETVLDAGCGSGRLTEELLRGLPNGRVIALDKSEDMLRAARERLAAAAARVEFIHADLADFTLSAPVDLIFSTATLHWVRDRVRMWPCLLRALKPGASIVAQFGGYGNLARIRERLAALIATQPPSRTPIALYDSVRFDTTDSVHQQLSESGFSDLDVSTFPAPVEFHTAAAFKTFLAKVNIVSGLARIPEETSSDVLDYLTARAASDDPPYTLDYVRINVRAHRPSA